MESIILFLLLLLCEERCIRGDGHLCCIHLACEASDGVHMWKVAIFTTANASKAPSGRPFSLQTLAANCFLRFATCSALASRDSTRDRRWGVAGGLGVKLDARPGNVPFRAVAALELLFRPEPPPGSPSEFSPV